MVKTELETPDEYARRVWRDVRFEKSTAGYNVYRVADKKVTLFKGNMHSRSIECEKSCEYEQYIGFDDNKRCRHARAVAIAIRMRQQLEWNNEES